MGDYADYSCGDAFCCLGESYPECQAIGDATHYSDDQPASADYTFTD